MESLDRSVDQPTFRPPYIKEASISLIYHP